MIQTDFIGVIAPPLGYIPGEISAEYLVEFASKTNLDFQLYETNDGLRLEVNGSRTYKHGHVDLVDHRMKQIYEIKPILAEQTGRAELYWYLSFLPDHALGTVYPSTPRTIGPWPLPPWSKTHVVRAENRQGVIVYWGAKRSQQRQPQTATVSVCVAVPAPTPVGEWCKHGEVNEVGCYCPHGFLPSGECAPESILPFPLVPGPLAPAPIPAPAPMPAPVPMPAPLFP